ncbi:hypothetical protein ACFX1W_012517 [Malus domestica]
MAEMVAMAAAKKKFVPLPKKAATIAHPSAKTSLIVASAAAVVPSKRFRPKVKTTGDVAQPQKWIKKKAKNGEQ